MLVTLALRKMLDTSVALINADTIAIKLFQNDLTPGPNTVVGDFVEADFSGYAVVAVNQVGIAWDDDDGNAAQSFDNAHFQGTTGAVTNTIYGWWMTGTIDGVTANQLIQAKRFDTPIPVNGSMDAIDFIPLLKIGMPLNDE